MRLELVLRASLAGTLGVVCFALAPARVQASGVPERALYTISIGENQIAKNLQTPENAGLPNLKYADDDAALFHGFMRDLSRRAFLLSILDNDTQRRFPDLAGEARVPTIANLAAVVTEVTSSMERDRADGREPVLLVFYSGHGVRDRTGAPGLALFDGALTQDWLYEKILAAVPARYVHLIVDACHAEAVIRPRDAEGRSELIDEADRQRYLAGSTLARFPNVGALLASTAGTQSFEWDTYKGGVFAHEILSGLRGAADVNGDGQIEYSELAAFVEAANQQIADPRVRPQVVVQPPRANRRAAIIDLSPHKELFRLNGWANAPWWNQPFFVETGAGVRLLDAFPEPGSRVGYYFPVDRPLYFVWPAGEAVVRPTTGGESDLANLVVQQRAARPRGAMELSMREGLFATAFGPSFYRGYVSQQRELIAVTIPAAGVSGSTKEGEPPPYWNFRRRVGAGLLIGGGAAALTAGAFGALAWNAWSRYQDTLLERKSTEARSEYIRDRYSAIIAASTSAALGVAGATIFYFSRRSHRTGIPLDGVALIGSDVIVGGHF